jgi:hypothetical protein
MPWTKKVAFTLIAALITAGAAEFLSWAALTSIVPSRLRNRTTFRSPEDYIRAYRRAVRVPGASGRESRALRMFHPILGWDYPPDYRYQDDRGVRYAHGERGERVDPTFSFHTSRIATYGDSFCYCADVGDAHTWQTRLGESLGAGVLNFGVAGYGTDQAFLKYELNEAAAAPSIVMLCILPDDINRIVNVFRTFYAPGDRVGLTKPRYVLEGDSIKLLPNPITVSAEVTKLENPEFVRSLGAHDYWFQRDLQLPRLGFPYTWSLMEWRHIWRRYVAFGLALRFPPLRPAYPPGNLFEEKEPLLILCGITDEFVRVARLRGSEPVIVIMAHKELIRETLIMGRPRTEPLTDHLKAKGVRMIDLISDITAMKPSNTQLERWYEEHATPEGNAMTARLIGARLVEMGLVARGSSPPR